MALSFVITVVSQRAASRDPLAGAVCELVNSRRSRAMVDLHAANPLPRKKAELRHATGQKPASFEQLCTAIRRHVPPGEREAGETEVPVPD